MSRHASNRRIRLGLGTQAGSLVQTPLVGSWTEGTSEGFLPRLCRSTDASPSSVAFQRAASDSVGRRDTRRSLGPWAVRSWISGFQSEIPACLFTRLGRALGSWLGNDSERRGRRTRDAVKAGLLSSSPQSTHKRRNPCPDARSRGSGRSSSLPSGRRDWSVTFVAPN